MSLQSCNQTGVRRFLLSMPLPFALWLPPAWRSVVGYPALPSCILLHLSSLLRRRQQTHHCGNSGRSSSSSTAVEVLAELFYTHCKFIHYRDELAEQMLTSPEKIYCTETWLPQDTENRDKATQSIPWASASVVQEPTLDVTSLLALDAHPFETDRATCCRHSAEKRQT